MYTCMTLSEIKLCKVELFEIELRNHLENLLEFISKFIIYT